MLRAAGTNYMQKLRLCPANGRVAELLLSCVLGGEAAGQNQSVMKDRINEYDYLKSVFITLMVVFHLAYFGDSHPYAKAVVYTFHMPAFLILSGYLANVGKPWRAMGRQLLWLFVPYAVMEAAYAAATCFMDVRGGIGELSAQSLAVAVLARPVGPYWYLHTLMLCLAAYWLAVRITRNGGGVATRMVLLGLMLWGLACGWGLMGMANAMYFLAGAVARQCRASLLSLAPPSWLAVVALALLCADEANLDKSAAGGAAITWLVFSFLLWLYPYIPQKAGRLSLFIGRNTLAILLFSPIFTMAVKPLIPFFAFDPTAISFAVVATALTLAGSLAVAWCMDRLGLSRWFCGGWLLDC